VIGSETKFQPVFVGDVAKMVACCLNNIGDHAGKTYELGGPQIFTMLALNQWIAKATGHNPIFLPLPDIAAKALAMGTGWLPSAPITMDQLRMLGSDNVVTGTDGLSACHIAATSLDTVAHDWLDIYRKHGRFAAKVPGV
jgi:NADH dehydrogenase